MGVDAVGESNESGSGPKEQDFAGRVALVTGGGSGLGQAAARMLAERGAKVLVADVDESGGGDTVRQCTDAGSEAVFLRTDVTSEADVEAMVGTAVDRWGRLDAAINNAGTTGPTKPTADYTLEEWNQVVALNLNGVFLGLKYEIPQMVSQGGGAIVNTSSGAGLMGFAGLPGYVATKHAVLGLTKASALEYIKAGVRINAVCPGSTRTPMLEGWMGGNPEIEKAMANSAPIGRLARPEEIAAGMVWLLSDAASFMVGHALAVDGGAVIM
jgi:NAD(P)-dependent dehydrogenase (short-subunit alcohol dehydrogenase family)